MPIYMDRHDLTEEVTAEHVAQIHQEDLRIEHKYGCKGLTYWFDGERRAAFCLIDAPNKEKLKEMHDQAHGAIPTSIIEVDPTLVESFLGRIDDPKSDEDTDLNLLIDHPFRYIMVTKISNNSLPSLSDIDFFLYFNENMLKRVIHFNGSLVKKKMDGLLISFKSISDAISCAVEIQKELIQFKKDNKLPTLKLKIGLSAGIPVSDGDEIFADTIKLAERLCNDVIGQIVLSSEVKDLYVSENANNNFNREMIRSLKPFNEIFLISFLDFMEKSWTKTDLKVEDFSKNLGFSKSQLYRKIKYITGKSLNTFIKEYRLEKAVELLKKQKGNISEIAFETGFNSPAYFSKCFHRTYGILPSSYIKQAS